MVMTASGLFRTGVQDWFYQRVSAVVILLYTLMAISVAVRHPHMDFAVWHALFSHLGVKVMTILALLSVVVHAWIGLWTVTTDYLKCSCIRVVVQTGVIVWLVALFVAGSIILGGV